MIRILTNPETAPLLERSLRAVGVSGAELHVFHGHGNAPEMLCLGLRRYPYPRLAVWMDQLIAVRSLYRLFTEVERLGIFAPTHIAREGRPVLYDQLIGASFDELGSVRAWAKGSSIDAELAAREIERPDPGAWVTPYADAPVAPGIVLLSRSAA